MEERARTLNGTIRFEDRTAGGTRVVLAFRPASLRAAIPVRKAATA
jgi:nitrate/nitrite-specific signal transduction histidine kinase